MAQELKQSKIAASDIQMGMYVSALDLPWEESPFLLQGFVVSSPKVLAKLQSLCEFVYVDNAQSIKPQKSDPHHLHQRAIPTILTKNQRSRCL